MTGFDFAEVTEDDPDYVPETVCPWCEGVFGPQDTGHCTGGPFGGCCLTFASNHAFDQHRTGTYEPDTRRCRTPEELLAKGWTRAGDFNVWRTPPPKNNPWKQDK